MSTITYEQLIAHVFSYPKFKSFLEHLCKERQHIDDHYAREGLLPLTHVLLVAPIDLQGNLYKVKGNGTQPWVTRVSQHMVKPWAQWSHCKNPLELAEDGKIHLITAAKGTILRTNPQLGQVYVDPECIQWEMNTEAHLLLTIEQLQQELESSA